MKTTLIGSVPATKKFPVLYQGSSGQIVLATSKNGGVVLFDPIKPLEAGYVFPAIGKCWSDCHTWTRINTPITIEFTP